MKIFLTEAYRVPRSKKRLISSDLRFSNGMLKFSDCSYFLAKNPDAQEELFQEIEEAVLSNGGDQHLDYNIIQSLPYLDQVKLNQNFTYFKHLKNYIFKLCYSNSDYIS
jgi:hypothetical protein